MRVAEAFEDKSQTSLRIQTSAVLFREDASGPKRFLKRRERGRAILLSEPDLTESHLRVYKILANRDVVSSGADDRTLDVDRRKSVIARFVELFETDQGVRETGTVVCDLALHREVRWSLAQQRLGDC